MVNYTAIETTGASSLAHEPLVMFMVVMAIICVGGLIVLGLLLYNYLN